MTAKLLQSGPSLCDLWTVAPQAPLSMGFSRNKYWSGLPCPFPGDLPHPGIKPSKSHYVSCVGRWFFFTWEALENTINGNISIFKCFQWIGFLIFYLSSSEEEYLHLEKFLCYFHIGAFIFFYLNIWTFIKSGDFLKLLLHH